MRGFRGITITGRGIPLRCATCVTLLLLACLVSQPSKLPSTGRATACRSRQPELPLSWNEIKSRALAFSRRWEGETSERAEAQSFWNDFFGVFGIERRRVAIFEKQVRLVRAAEKLRGVGVLTRSGREWF